MTRRRTGDRRTGTDRRGAGYVLPPLADSHLALLASTDPDTRAVGEAQARVIDSARRDPHLTPRARWAIFGEDRRNHGGTISMDSVNGTTVYIPDRGDQAHTVD